MLMSLLWNIENAGIHSELLCHGTFVVICGTFELVLIKRSILLSLK